MKRLTSLLQPWATAVADLLFPRECDSCQNPQGPFQLDQRLCRSCFDALVPVRAPYCEKCAEPFPAEDPTNFLCPNCSGRKFAFDFAFSPYESRGPVRELIHNFKYNKQLHLRHILGALIHQALEEPRLQGSTEWIITPVPLHSKRFREREFNQSQEIARILQRKTQFPLIAGLKRIRYTTGQAKLDRKGRLKNLKGAFTLTPKALRQQAYAGRSILLIDDVLTTGATLHECAQVLKEQGQAKQVIGLCVARG